MRPKGLVVPSLVLVVLLPLTCRCLSLAGIDRLRHGYISGIGGVMPSGNVHWIDNGGIYSRRKTSSRINRGWIRLTAFSLWTFGDFLHEKRHRSPDFVLWMQGGGNESPTKGDTGHAETTKNADANEECSRNEINAGVSEKSEKTDEELDPNAKLNAIIAGLEKKLKEAEKDLDIAKKNIIDRGKTGYLKLVAQVDNYRKQKEEDRQRQQNNAMAGVLRSFLPVLDALEASTNDVFTNTEEEERIISNYGVIFSEIMTTFKKLGMVEYNAQHGNYFENRIYSKVGEEYNEEISRNFIISGIKPGFKVHGIVIRPAECIVSLGKEPMDEEKGGQNDVVGGEEATTQESAVEADVE